MSLLIKLRAAFWVISLAVELFCGCASYGSHLTATPIDPERGEASVHADAVLLDRGFGPQLMPNPELAFRRGYSKDVDFGGRINVAGGELNTRLRVLHDPTADMALVPYLGAGFVPMTNRDTGILRAPLGMRLITGFHAGKSTDLVLGLNGAVEAQAPLLALRGHTEDLKFLLSPGCTVGAELALSDSLKLHPEINFVAPYDPSDRSAEDQRAIGFQKPIVQAGLAFKWLSF